jgi:hypothetical protein
LGPGHDAGASRARGDRLGSGGPPIPEAGSTDPGVEASGLAGSRLDVP